MTDRKANNKKSLLESLRDFQPTFIAGLIMSFVWYFLNTWIDYKVEKITEIHQKKLEKILEINSKVTFQALEVPLIITRIENDIKEIKKLLFIKEEGVEEKYANTEDKKTFYKLTFKLFHQIQSFYYPFDYGKGGGHFRLPSERDFKEIYELFNKLDELDEKMKNFSGSAFMGFISLKNNVIELQRYYDLRNELENLKNKKE